MAFPIFYNGSIVIIDGAPAISAACCCDAPPSDPCCFLDATLGYKKLNATNPYSNAVFTVERSDGMGGYIYWSYTQVSQTVQLGSGDCILYSTLTCTLDGGSGETGSLRIRNNSTGQLEAFDHFGFPAGMNNPSQFETCDSQVFNNNFPVGSGQFYGSFDINCVDCDP